MQRDRGVRENSTTSGGAFVNSGDFGFRGSMFPSIFGGKDPFDDPFFTRPLGGMFGSDMYTSGAPANNLQHANRSKGPVIEELDSDAEAELEKKQENDVTDAAWANKNPLVEHPEDQDNGKSTCFPFIVCRSGLSAYNIPNLTDHGKSKSKGREVSFNTNHNNVDRNRAHTKSASFQRVTYGGINGAYYTATTTRTTGSDGVTLEESKQADRTTGQATHTISRGIQDKGHSVTRKLDSDGKVDTVQTLHNLNEDELVGFEQAWKGNTDRHLHGHPVDFPGNSGNIAAGHGQLAPWGGYPDPFKDFSGRHGMQNFDRSFQAQSSGGKPKKIVTINIE
ncbi:UNVERIFIED_CONTAM: hypothetical protein Sradi_0528100 [Sesamum radiatum]|uniref:Uncharacterized protein n=1 Tax=Sesamum radiatum TaxID=300843 RepID=A0AAW2VIY0_SESRA